MTITELANIISNILGPLVVGYVLWLIGQNSIEKNNQNDAIRDLMTFRGGDFSSPEFRRSLNKISITFHKDAQVRKEIRELYDIINNPSSLERNINRKIVGLIYILCQKNGFGGITEYDIDQSFPESKQSPDMTTSTGLHKTSDTSTTIPTTIKSEGKQLKKSKK